MYDDENTEARKSEVDPRESLMAQFVAIDHDVRHLTRELADIEARREKAMGERENLRQQIGQALDLSTPDVGPKAAPWIGLSAASGEARR